MENITSLKSEKTYQNILSITFPTLKRTILLAF